MRFDVLITKKKLVRSRNTASDLIKAGLIRVNGEIIIKPAKDISDTKNLKIEIIRQPKYVSRGGLKLEKALADFKINPLDLTVLDVGSSTGGFTDCLLQQGAKKVYAVDVGIDQFNLKLKNDPRIILMEKTDIRNVSNLQTKPDLAVIDVSFISLELVLKKVADLLIKKGKIIALIKPQFETLREDKNKNGIVKNEEIRQKVLEKIKKYCQKNKLKISNTINSPILGGSGNREYLILIEK